jgi:hypothetical protein
MNCGTVRSGAAALVRVLACSGDAPTAPPDLRTTDGGVDHELAPPDTRIEPEYVNAHVYGSFRVGTSGGAGGVITSGPANFPGHPPAGPGSCEDGRWINANGRPTAGSLMKPHPHCIAASSSVEVVLEPISACYTIDGVPACREPTALIKGLRINELVLGRFFVEDVKPVYRNVGLRGATQAGGIVVIGEPTAQTTMITKDMPTRIVGYAIDAATLGTTNRRVGTIAIDLLDFASTTENLLDFAAGECLLDAALDAPCINRVITAVYQPLPAPDGVGAPDTAVEGFLWMTAATAPYNYSQGEE